MAGGFGAGVAKIGLLGWSRPETADLRTKKALDFGNSLYNIENGPVYRSGGLWWLASMAGILPRGYAGFGQDIIVNEKQGDAYQNFYLWTHETAHFWQYEVGGYGRGIGKLGWSQLKRAVTFGAYNPYKQVRNLEWIANEVWRELRNRYYY